MNFLSRTFIVWNDRYLLACTCILDTNTGGLKTALTLSLRWILSNEACQLTSPLDAISGPFDLLTIGESLALAPCDYSVCDHIDIWILEDCVKGLWSKKYSIAKDLYNGCGRNLRSRLLDCLRPIAALDNGKVVIFQEFNELRLLYFVVGCNKFGEIQSPWKKLHTGEPQYPAIIKVFDHISTLASPYAQ